MICFKNIQSHFKQDSGTLADTENQIPVRGLILLIKKVRLDLKKMPQVLRVIDYILIYQESLKGYLFLKYVQPAP